ncbi:DUF3298 and DUF4163 domain-containing protein [Pseudobutyrivibrio sp.]|uniref:DUF3298 and DUF4163 domain-containing protein n=1 Tax=Pseudobutyrivibrio sp. TaxID=2014367 RepID=UPI0025D79DF8|nr:DUF3298 and DUF4163 domain-containing protein [Pseudobutyrivibrio sp.]
MKKKIPLMLVVALVTFALIACDTEETEKAATPQKVTETTEEPEETVNDTDSLPEYTYTAVAYDDVYEYFTGSIQCVEITDTNHSTLADAVNEYFSEQVETFNKTCENMVNEAKDTNAQLEKDKADNEGAENEFVYDYVAYYSYTISAEVTRCDNQLFSIHLSEYDYEGGANGVQNEYGVTFDTQTGEILENTSFEASVSNIAQAIRNDIDNSSEEAKSMLMDDYDDYIARMETGLLSTVGVWFNERGIVIGFPESTIAPHAAGSVTFNIPYSQLEGFDEKYIPSGDFYTSDISTFGLADLIDVNGDGENEIVYLESVEDEENYSTEFTLHIGENEIKLNDPDVFYCEPMFVHSSTGNYIMIVTSGSSDWNVIHLYDADKNYTLVQELDGSIQNIEDNVITVQYRVDAFGTWGATKDYQYDGNGFSTTETFDKLSNDPRTNGNAMGITLKKDLRYTDNNGDSATVEKGTVIYPITKYDSEIEFVNEDGTIQGIFTYKYKDGVRYVDGESEYDLFDNMPYAG